MNRNGLAVCLGSVLALFVSGAVLAQSDWLQGAFSPIKHTRDIRPAVGVVVPRIASRPVIDGILKDAVWKRAATIPKFTHGSTRIRARTGVFLLADEHYLYVAYKCDEREMKKLRAQIKPSKKRDLAVWDDDSVELYVDPTGEGGKHYQFLMNAAGALYYAEGGGRGTEWQATFDAKAHRDKKFWSAEFGIPFNILGLDGTKPSLSVRMQFSRTAMPERLERTSWRPNWNDPKSFGPVIIGRAGSVATIERISLGNFCVGSNKLRIAVKNFPEGAYEARLKIDGKVVRSVKFQGGDREASIPYELMTDNENVKVAVTVRRTDTKPVRILERIERTFHVPGALAVCFRNAHIAESKSTRMWVRALLGDVGTPRPRATVLDERGEPVRSLNLPPVPGGAGAGWFTLDATGLSPGAYSMRVESADGRTSATAKFWVERVALPDRASVPLFVDEPVQRDWHSFPVSVGVPFPRARLDSAERVRVVDGEGREVPSQAKVTSTWNPDKRDVRWLLVDFLADSIRQKGSEYRLEFGRAVRRAPVANPVKVSETNDSVVVDTGEVRFAVDRRKGSILEEVRLNGRKVIAGEGAGVYLQNQDRKVFCSAWDREAPEVVVEERGPIRAVVRQSGWYAAKDGERLCRYDIRIHAFAGQPYLKILHTWVLTHDSRKVQFGDISLRFPLGDRVRRCAFGMDDAHDKPPYESELGDNDMVNLVQEDSDRFKMVCWRGGAQKVLQRGTKGGGWVAAWTGSTCVTAHLRDMWQQYPAELEVGRNALAVHFWPEHGFSYKHRERPDRYGVHRWPYTAGPFMDLQPREYIEKVLMKDVEKIKGYDRINALGMSRTQEIWLDLRAATRTAAEAQERARKYEEPLAARADAQWISDTRVFRPFLPVDEKTFPRIEQVIRARWQGQTYLQDRCHDYGWLHYGDRHSQAVPIGPGAKFKRVHRYWLVSDYRCGMEPWLLWARSGERMYYRWAEVISRHVMDVDMIHWTGEQVGPPRRKGQFYPMSFAHYCSAPTSTSLHNDPIGFNMMYYYLTGYRRSLDVLTASGARELADVDLSRSRMNRGHAVTGHNQLDMYRITWEEPYWENAFKAINKGLDAMVSKEYLDFTYVYEWLHDIEEFTGDSRVRTAVLNIADNNIGKPLGTRSSYPALYVFGHAYEHTGDPKYIAWGKGRLELDTACINVSDDPERRGRLIDHDNIHLTRLFRQVPGFMHYQKQAEAKHGAIERRTQPILFLYEKGPVYLREDTDRAFTVRVHLRFGGSRVSSGDIRIVAPDGSVAVKRSITPSDLPGSRSVFELVVPADKKTGTYRLDLNVPTMAGGLVGYWGIESPDIRKIAYQIKKFTYQGNHVFFYVPKGTKSFRLRVEPRAYAILVGEHPVLGPDGRETMRLDALNTKWVTIKPKEEDTGGLWCVILYYRGNFEMDGLPPFLYSDPAEFFIPKGPIVKKAISISDVPRPAVPPRPEFRWTFDGMESFDGLVARLGRPEFAPGRKGQAVKGDISLGPNGAFNYKEGTVCFWMKPGWDDTRVATILKVHSPRGHECNSFHLGNERDDIYFFITDAKRGRWDLRTEVRGIPDASWQEGQWMHVGFAWKHATGDMVIYINGKEAAKQTVRPIVQDPKQIGQWIVLAGGSIGGPFDELFVSRKFDPSLIVREMRRAQ